MRKWMLQPVRHCASGELPVPRRMSSALEECRDCHLRDGPVEVDGRCRWCHELWLLQEHPIVRTVMLAHWEAKALHDARS